MNDKNKSKYNKEQKTFNTDNQLTCPIDAAITGCARVVAMTSDLAM